MATSPTVARLSRWALLAAAVLMGGALLATVWTTHGGIEDASETLERGQADILEDAIRTSLIGLGAAPTGADLAALLGELEPDGLRYVAAVDRGGRIVAEAGAPLSARAELARARAAARVGPVAVGDRLRVVMRTRPRRGGRMPPGRLGPWPGALVFELEPQVAAGLRDASRQTLAVGALAAGGFLILALVLFRWILHREALERTLEQGRRLASLGQMSAVLAHEIRNPLASLKGNAQLLARSLPDGERSRAKADLVVAEAVRLETLTNDLLEFARTGAIRREEVDPAAVLRDAAAAASGRVDIDASGAPALWPMDRARMQQVLQNLIDNAAHAADTPVEARVAMEGAHLVYVVRDHGPGIAEEDLERVFEPFYSRRTRGTGLGLALARRIVELHGGTLTADNPRGGGAELRARLPRT